MTTPEKPVCVTGASGYIGSWIVYHLLSKGYDVHGTVRDPNKTKSVAHLQKMNRELSGKLTLFKADLLHDGSFFDAMQGCEVVIHTASPFLIGALKDPQAQLIDPALNGTKNVLNSVNNTPSIKRVVLTSSVAAIYGDSRDINKTASGVFDETHWNTSSRADHQPYQYSKVVAERAAWDMQKAQHSETPWQLVTINPALVMGPSLTTATASGSISVLKQFVNGALKTGAPNLTNPLVDVQDVAKAHVAAAFSENASGRYAIVDKTMNFLEMGRVLRKHFGDKYPFPSRTLPKTLIWAVAPFVDLSREMVRKNMGYNIAFDNAKSRRELGISYQPVEKALVAHFQQLIDDGVIKDKRQ